MWVAGVALQTVARGEARDAQGSGLWSPQRHLCRIHTCIEAQRPWRAAWPKEIGVRSSGGIGAVRSARSAGLLEGVNSGNNVNENQSHVICKDESVLEDPAAATPSAHINPDGLTYRHKPSGSPFNGGAGLQGQSMSCFLCGRHRPRAKLRSRLLLGRHHAVCAPSCKALEAAAAADGADTGVKVSE